MKSYIRNKVLNGLQKLPRWVHFLYNREGYTFREAYRVYLDTMRRDINVMKKKTSDKVAIMGCGPSINEITKSDIDLLEEIDVIGMNYFIHHDIVPDILSIEATYMGSTYVTEETHDIQREHGMIRLINRKKEKLKDMLLLVRYCGLIYRGTSIAEAMNKLETNHVKLVDIPRVHVNKKNDINKKVYEGSDPNEEIPNFQASCDMCIGLAYMMGYKEIILYGVDLSEGYFWSHSRVPKGTRHSTSKSSWNNVTMDQIIPIMRENILNPEGAEIYVSSKSSNLYPDLPLWKVS